MTELDGAIRLAIAGLVGLGVGVEREWTIHASGRPPRFAGLRTFSLLGLLGGCAGLLMTTGHAGVAAATIAGGMALSVTAYVMSVRHAEGDPDGTTEVPMGHHQIIRSATFVSMDFHIAPPGDETADSRSLLELRFTALGNKRTRVVLTQSNWEAFGKKAPHLRDGGYGQAWGAIFEGAFKAACGG